jgi:outer membrane protein OmpA-like peptidoglycan-associated protein
MEQNIDVTDDLMFFAGCALQYAGRFEEAADKLSEYLKSQGKKDDKMVESAEKLIEECRAGAEILKDTLRVEIKPLDLGINTAADEYAAVLTADGLTMYFATRRPLSNSSKFDDEKYDENILISNLTNNNWGMARAAGRNLYTRFCETPLYLSPSGEELYIYTGYESGGDIKVSSRKKDAWRKPEAVPFKINSSGAETSLTFTPDNREVWFVSDRSKDGFGGKDIYVIRKLGDSKWSKPANAGSMVNSSRDEESPRFSKNGDTLYFSSRGHNSIGGFDVFYSVRDVNGIWGPAVNCGYPVNTPWDELFYFPLGSADSLFYFASNRPESRGGLDIFRGKFMPPEPLSLPVAEIVLPPPVSDPDTVIVRDTIVIIKEVIQAPQPPPAPVVEKPVEDIVYLIGKVKDSETGDPILAKIDVIDMSSDAVIATTASSDVDGSYRVRLPGKKSFMVDVRGAGFLSGMQRVSIPPDYAEESYNLDVSLIKVKVGKKVILNNILFQTGKSILTTASFEELDRLYNILTDNPTMRVEISGHTDKTGSEPVNFKLSEARAKAVVDYLIKKGIVPARMEFRGFGSLQPIADNATAEGRTQNRRVEFKILEF